MSRKLALPLLLLFVAPVYLYTAAGGAILDDGDALYAHVAQQMVVRGDWITPYANGVRFLDKPPLMYWLMASAYELLGMSEFAARLPSVLAVLGSSILLFFLGGKAAGPWAGFTAGAAMALSVGTFLFTRMVFPDILFVFLLTLSLSCFLDWYCDRSHPVLPAMLFSAALAGAVLTKGLIGIFFPAAVVVLFMAWRREWKRLRRFHLVKGALLFLGLALPWHLLAAWRNPGFLWHFFVNEQVLRFLGRRQPLDYESISLPIFWLLILLWVFPWSLFLPSLAPLLRAAGDRTSSSYAILWLSLFWAAVILVFFSFSSRIEHYALPLFPPLALLVGISLFRERQDEPADGLRRQDWVRRGFAGLGIMGGTVALILLAAALLWLGGGFRGQAPQGSTSHPLQAYKYYFAPLFELPPQILGQLLFPLLGAGLSLSAGLLGAWWLNRRGARGGAVIAMCGMMVLFCLFASRSLGLCEVILSSRQFGQQLARVHQAGDRLIVAGDFETANSVNFYCALPLEVYRGTAAVLQRGLEFPDAPERVLSQAEFEDRWNGASRTFLLVRNDQLAGLGLGGFHQVLVSGGRTLVCNRPPD